jgi:hypothetical protein
MSVKAEQGRYATNGIRMVYRPDGEEGFTNRDWIYAGLHEDEIEDSIRQSKLGIWIADIASRGLHKSDKTVVASVPQLLANAFVSGAAQEYTRILNDSGSVSGEKATVFWGFKGVKSAILQDGSIRMAAGVLFTRAADFPEGNEFREKFQTAGEKLLLIADIPPYTPGTNRQ